jgi:hypothetical protein
MTLYASIDNSAPGRNGLAPSNAVNPFLDALHDDWAATPEDDRWVFLMGVLMSLDDPITWMEEDPDHFQRWLTLGELAHARRVLRRLFSVRNGREWA